MDITKLVTADNNVAINQVLIIAKQDIAIQNAIDALVNLLHINNVVFESYGKQYGVTKELMDQVYEMRTALDKAKFGRY